MNKKKYIWVYLLSLGFFTAISFLQKTPGYMDASYYYAMGKQIAAGNAGSEPFIWNYLANPVSIPAVSFTYWMPFAAILAAFGMILVHSTVYWAARLPFVLLAGLIPVINVYFASGCTKNKYLQIMSAFFGVLSAYYLVYQTISETFVPYIVLGGLFLILLQKIFSNITQARWFFYFLLGITAGVLHLTRADGILWGITAGFVILFLHFTSKIPFKKSVGNLFLLVFGYFVVMSPWYIRNLSIFGSLFPSGSNLAVFFTQYDDLFKFSAAKINSAVFFSTGAAQILSVRLNSMWANIKNLIGTAGEIILFPFIGVAAWKFRRNRLTQFALLMLAEIFIFMSLVFPFAGARGGFIHSASSLQCYFWGIAPIGFEEVIRKLAEKRKWKVERSIPLLGNTLLAILALLSVGIFYSKVLQVEDSTTNQIWNQNYCEFSKIGQTIDQIDPNDQTPVMVNDSPGFFVMTGRPAIQMTVGDLNDTISAMKKFHSHYLILGADHSPEYDNLYLDVKNENGFIFIDKIDQFIIYELVN
jgi:hypothetical protein